MAALGAAVPARVPVLAGRGRGLSAGLAPRRSPHSFIRPMPWARRWENPLDPVVRDLDFSQVCAGRRARSFSSAPRMCGPARSRSSRARRSRPRRCWPRPACQRCSRRSRLTARPIGMAAIPATRHFSRFMSQSCRMTSWSCRSTRCGARSCRIRPLEIQNRINEISFNASLLGELRAINFVRRLIAEGRMERGRMKEVRVHMIADDGLMNDAVGDDQACALAAAAGTAESGRAGGGGPVPGRMRRQDRAGAQRQPARGF